MKKNYRDNIGFLQSMIDSSIESLIQEEYYFDGKLDSESMGTLKMKFQNGLEYTFDCDGDAESLNLRKGGFPDKGTMKTDWENNKCNWKQREFLSLEKINQLGKIVEINLETLTSKHRTIQSGCKIDFLNSDYLYIWTIESDNIFYGLNKTPPYHDNKKLKIELKKVNAVQQKL